MMTKYKCPVCYGDGFLEEADSDNKIPCFKCHGDGFVYEEEIKGE